MIGMEGWAPFPLIFGTEPRRRRVNVANTLSVLASVWP